MKRLQQGLIFWIIKIPIIKTESYYFTHQSGMLWPVTLNCDIYGTANIVTDT